MKAKRQRGCASPLPFSLPFPAIFKKFSNHTPPMRAFMARQGKSASFSFRESDLSVEFYLRRGKHGLGQVFRANAPPVPAGRAGASSPYVSDSRRHARAKLASRKSFSRQTSGDIPLAVQKKITRLKNRQLLLRRRENARFLFLRPRQALIQIDRKEEADLLLLIGIERDTGQLLFPPRQRPQKDRSPPVPVLSDHCIQPSQERCAREDTER